MAALVFSAAIASFADHAQAIIDLLNSRAANSPNAYEKAAREVAAEATREGEKTRVKVISQYVLGLASEDDDFPSELRPSEELRKIYVASNHNEIARLVIEKDNPLGWYLFYLETGNTNALKKAVDGKNPQALNAWGSKLVNDALMGESLKEAQLSKRFREAYGCFREAVAQDDANGYYNLGTCYAHGWGTNRDDGLALNCFRSAAEKGHPEAMNNIGWFFRDGRAVPQSDELSARWFEKSAKMRNPYGMFNYALALQKGVGVAQDREKAFEYLRKSSDGNCVQAIDAMGMALMNGIGVEKNVGEAVKAFRKAADLGYATAMNHLSQCYDEGIGVKANGDLSLLWKIRSRAALGDANAAAWLKQNDR